MINDVNLALRILKIEIKREAKYFGHFTELVSPKKLLHPL